MARREAWPPGTPAGILRCSSPVLPDGEGSVWSAASVKHGHGVLHPGHGRTHLLDAGLFHPEPAARIFDGRCIRPPCAETAQPAGRQRRDQAHWRWRVAGAQARQPPQRRPKTSLGPGAGLPFGGMEAADRQTLPGSRFSGSEWDRAPSESLSGSARHPPAVFAKAAPAATTWWSARTWPMRIAAT